MPRVPGACHVVAAPRVRGEGPACSAHPWSLSSVCALLLSKERGLEGTGAGCWSLYLCPGIAGPLAG